MRDLCQDILESFCEVQRCSKDYMRELPRRYKCTLRDIKGDLADRWLNQKTTPEVESHAARLSKAVVKGRRFCKTCKCRISVLNSSRRNKCESCIAKNKADKWTQKWSRTDRTSNAARLREFRKNRSPEKRAADLTKARARRLRYKELDNAAE